MIIGVTGTNGAGKGTIVDFLKEKGFEHFSVRKYLKDILISEGKNTERENMIELGNRLRNEYGPDYIIKELYGLAVKCEKHSVIESLRCPGEIEFLKNQYGTYMFAIDADRLKRYNRICARNSSTDHISYNDFVRQEKLEFENEDLFKQNLKKCIEMSDPIFENNGSIQELYSQVERVIEILCR